MRQFFYHRQQDGFQEIYICRIFPKSAFSTYAFGLAIGDNRGVVYAVGLFPEGQAILAEKADQYFRRKVHQHPNGVHTEVAKQFCVFFPAMGIFSMSSGVERILRSIAGT